MYIKKWLLVAGLLLFTIAEPAWAASAGNYRLLELRLEGKKVAPEIRVLEKGDFHYINLPFISRYFHSVSEWNPDEGTLDLKFGKLYIQMREGNTKYYVDGGNRRLRTAPFERGGELWLPLEFIMRLGLSIRSLDSRRLDLAWKHNYLLGVENTRYQDRPAFLLVGTEQMKIRAARLRKPERLVLELSGSTVHFAMESINPEASDPVVEKVRFAQADSDTVRLTFQLKQDVGYRLINNPDRNQVTLVFNYLIEAIGLVSLGEEHKVQIHSTSPAVYQVKSINNPNRLVIDLVDATLKGKASPLTGDGRWIGAIRMSQYDPGTVRVVLDLKDTIPSFVVRSRLDPNLLEVRTIQDIKRIGWEKDESGDKLVIAANGELMESLRMLKSPARLEILLDYARLDPNLRVPESGGSQGSMRIDSPEGDKVRIEVPLAYFGGYETELSPDHRQMTIHFRESPLVQKTIVLDAGHGGVDLGACGRQGTREKEINLEVTLYLKDLLEDAGARVVLTRDDDSYISLYERAFTANYLTTDLFLSIHTNNHPDHSVRGIEVYHYPGRTEAAHLAGKVINGMVAETGLKSLGVKTNDFVVIRETQMPSILLEIGYLSNYEEESEILTPEFRRNAARGIFQGIIDYYLE